MILIFSFLYPSWNFFDRAGMAYTCQIKTSQAAEWIELYPRTESRPSVASLFFSARNIEYLFFHSILASLAEKTCNSNTMNEQIFSLKEYKNLIALVQNYLIKNNSSLNGNCEIQILAKKLTQPESPNEIIFKTQAQPWTSS